MATPARSLLRMAAGHLPAATVRRLETPSRHCWAHGPVFSMNVTYMIGVKELSHMPPPPT